MKIIQLTHNKSTIVDDEVFEKVSSFKWKAFKNGKKYGQYYAATQDKPRVKLHNLLMDCPTGFVVDHKDGDSLNNLKSNLRLATVSQNSANRKVSSSKKGPQYLGVHATGHGKFIAFSNKDRIRYRTARYDTAEEAAIAYNELATT